MSQRQQGEISPPSVLHYLITNPRPHVFVAHCLDLDLVATGPDMEAAEHTLNVLVKTHIDFALTHGNSVMLEQRAPKDFWDQFHRIENVSLETLDIPRILPKRQLEVRKARTA